MWVDTNPFNSNGKPANKWVLAATYEDNGVPEHKNIAVTWKCHKDVCRVDGFASVDFTLISDREILFGASEPTSTANISPVSQQQEHVGFNEMISKAKNIFKKVTR